MHINSLALMRCLTRLLMVSLLLSSPLPGSAETEAPGNLPSKKRFTIQTGTFASYGQSLRQFMDLGRRLERDLIQDMRIERLERYYVVRLASDTRIEDSYRKLAVVREAVPDAFAMNESPETHKQTVYLYPDVSATLGSYTLVVSRHPEKDEALVVIRDLKKNLDREVHSLLVLERQGERFLVSIGPFDTYVAARTLQLEMRDRRGKTMELQSRSPGDGTERIAIDEPEADSKAASASDPAQKAETEVPSAVEPFEAEEIVKPLENIDTTMNDYLDEKEYGKALEVIKRAIERYPDNPDLYAWYGTVYMEMDRPDKALEHYQRAAELAPAVPEYQSNVGYGYLYLQQASARESINAFNRALVLEPENTDALEGLGTIYVSIGRKDLAVGIQEELKLLDPVAARRLQELIRYGIAIEPAPE